MAASVAIKSKGPAPTVDQINADRVTQLANQYWAPHTKHSHLPFDHRVVEDIYATEVFGSKFSIRRIMMLEFSQYLENYLWPNYNKSDTKRCSHAHMMSIVVMINEKFRERVPAWQALKKQPDEFAGFFQQVLETSLSISNLSEETALIVFLNHCFNSMEVELVREQFKRLISLSMWISLQQSRRELELRKVPKWRKYWTKIQKRDLQEANKDKLDWERRFLHRLILKFVDRLEATPVEGEISTEHVHYCERFLELMIDLEALLPTRRFFNTVMDDCHLVVRCYLSPLLKREEGNLFSKMSRARRVIIPDDEEDIQLVNDGGEGTQVAENEARPGPSGLQHFSAGVQINPEPNELSITLIDVIMLFYSYGLISVTLWQEALRRAEEKVKTHPSIKIKSLFQILKIYIQGLRTRVMLPCAYDNNQIGILDVLQKTLPCEILVGARGLNDSEKPQFLKSDVDEIWNYMKICNRKRTIEDIFNEEAILQREPFTYSQSIEIKLNDKQFLAWTPAKKGKYLVRLELFETDDIEGLSFKDRYKRIKTKLEMVINENDECFELINDIISQACDNFKAENGYKKVVRPVVKVSSPTQQKN